MKQRFVATLALVVLLGIPVGGQPLVWCEAESYTEATGTVQLIDSATGDYGRMAKAEASGKRFLRLGPGARITLPAISVETAGARTAWVRCFPMPGRRATLVVDGKDIGTSSGDADTITLVWHCLGTVDLAVGEHVLHLRAADGNTGLAYVDAVLLLANPDASPYGRTPEQIISEPPAERIADDFSATSIEALGADWTLNPPPGEDARLEMVPGEDGGAVHIHNGAGGAYSLVSRRPLRVRPGEQVTLRLRVRKRTLCESLTVSVSGVGTLAPQLYRQFTDYERTWLVPPGLTGPALVRIDGHAGGDTYISRLDVFRPDPPLSSFATGRFVPRQDNRREGRLFEIERYVVNSAAFSADTDKDGDGLWTLARLSQEENEVRFSRGTCLKSDTVDSDHALPEDGCPPLHVRVGPLEPGRYQVYLNAPGRALAFSRDGKDWTRLPGNVAPAFGLLTITDPWFEFWLDDRYAEPANPGPVYADYIRFMPIEDPAYTMAPATAPKPLARGGAERRQVPLTIANDTDSPRVREPVVSGVPIPQGDLSGPEYARLLDASGATVPCHISSTGRWPDGSVKWLLLDFQASVRPNASTIFSLEYGNAVVPTRAAAGLSITREGAGLRIDTGPANFVFEPNEGRPLVATLRGATTPALSLDGTIAAVDGRHWQLSSGRDATVVVEEESPYRVVVRLRGRFTGEDGPGPIEFDHRIHLFAGRAEALIEYGFVPTTAEDTIPLRLIQVHLGGAASGVAEFVPGDGKTVRAAVTDGPRLLQTGEGHYGSQGGFPFVVGVEGNASLAAGQKAAGVLRIGGAGPQLVCVPRFWEQFPKALGCDARGAVVDLWPDAPDVAPFVAHAGSAKSHRIGISLLSNAAPSRWLHPLFAAASSEWYCASGAFEGMTPRRSGQYAGYEGIVDAAFEQTMAARAGYGMEDWGDVWQEGYVAGAKTWSNQEWDLTNNWAIPFVRTGDMRFLDYAHEAARHFADVDCIHDHRDPSWVGGSWMHAHTSLVGHQLEPPNFSHAGWTEGMLNVYHLTGDRRGLEAAIGIADWIARHAPQRDSLPAGGPPYNLRIQRPAGWPLTTLCLLYRETWKPEYLQTARRIVDYARRCQDPQSGAWDAQVGHEAPYRGGCVFAYTLLRGLRLYADISGEKRAEKDYVNAARWMLCELWRPGHRYLYEQCPLHEPGGRVPFLLSEMAGYATRLSGDPIFAVIGHDAFEFNTSSAQAPGLIRAARRSQWGNGILTQAPRLLHDWEQTGLTAPSQVTLVPTRTKNKLPIERPGTVTFVLRNASAKPMERIAFSTMVRSDWRAEVVSSPPRIEAGGEGLVEIRCQAPPPVMRYLLQNDLAHLHVLAKYRLGNSDCATWSAVRLDVAQALELSGGAGIALKPGTGTDIVLDVTDGVEANPDFAVQAGTDFPGVVLGTPEITAGAAGSARIRLTVQAEANAKPAQGIVTVEVRSGPRQASISLDAEVGRFRAVMIENPLGEDWRYPFKALRTYSGIAIEFMPPKRLPQQFPDTAQGIAARWETVIIGDTGPGAAVFSPAQLQALADFVRAGGGLLMVGGAKCYTPGGYDRTPLVAILPVDLIDGSYRMGSVAVEVLKPKLVFFEGYDPVFPAFGAHQILKAKPEGQVIARFADGTPFATLGTAGKGRVLCLGAIWNHGSGTAFRQWHAYGRFIGRSVRWTAGDLKAE